MRVVSGQNTHREGRLGSVRVRIRVMVRIRVVVLVRIRLMVRVRVSTASVFLQVCQIFILRY